MSHIKNKIGRSETIEVAILNSATREYKFSDNESTLQNVVIEGIIIHKSSLVLSKQNRTLLPDGDLVRSLITLATRKQKLPIKELPISTFLDNDNAVTWLKPFLIDIAKSSITIPHANLLSIPVGPPSGFAIMITIFYRPFDATKDRVDEDGCIIE